ncbi:MAG: hypothetical protein EP329_12700 [Deltaproteobacteria bacterium]|nr:MAG: hypothetical protein EP329_12700 [Deltaproteobacteria bacterium]
MVASIQTLQNSHPTALVASHTIDVACPPHAFYDVIADYESYPDFVPAQRTARILSRERDGHFERLRVAMGLSVVKTIDMELAVEGIPGHSMEWRMVQGELLRAIAGAWLLEELPDGSTRAQLHQAIVLKTWLPKMVVRTLIEKTLPSTARAFKREAERRHRM